MKTIIIISLIYSKNISNVLILAQVALFLAQIALILPQVVLTRAFAQR